MKFSEIPLETLKEHVRINDNEDDYMLDNYLNYAKRYVLSYTGLTEMEADLYEDLVFAVLALAGDFYENRINTASTYGKPNPIVESILSMHSVNLLWIQVN